MDVDGGPTIQKLLQNNPTVRSPTSLPGTKPFLIFILEGFCAESFWLLTTKQTPSYIICTAFFARASEGLKP